MKWYLHRKHELSGCRKLFPDSTKVRNNKVKYLDLFSNPKIIQNKSNYNQTYACGAFIS